MRRVLSRSLVRAALFLLALPACSQLDAIHTQSLPATPAVRGALDDLTRVGAYAHLFPEQWHYPTPKDAVAKRLTADFDALSKAQHEEPQNTELRLLTALSGRFAYNLELDRAYLPTQQLLQEAVSLGGDYRALWFLGMLQCQSNNVNGGMDKLLAVEKMAVQPPATFWRDYGICALQANMPAHASRAFDRAEQGGALDAVDEQIWAFARNGYDVPKTTASYAPEQAWTAERVNGGFVRFSSTLCGLSFTVKDDARIDARPVSDGKCVVSISPAGFNENKPHRSPTLLLLVLPAPPNTDVATYASGLTKDKYGEPQRPTDLPCPVANCVASEFKKGDMYADAGGAHLLSVAFTSVQSQYPGLALEEPDGPPVRGGGRTYLRPARRLQRLPGTMYVLALMDASAAIYEPSKLQYIALLQSLRVDAPE